VNSPRLRWAAALLLAAAGPVRGWAQGTPPAAAPDAGPPLASFSAMRVAIAPVQLWRADTAGWSAQLSWAALRVAVDSAIGAELQARGLGRRWAYPLDVIRSARRNPTYSADPYALGVGRWRSTPPVPGTAMPPLLADNLRPLTAIDDTRYVLLPVELRADGAVGVLRLVLVDARSRSVLWVGDLAVPGGPRLVADLATRLADLIVEP